MLDGVLRHCTSTEVERTARARRPSTVLSPMTPEEDMEALHIDPAYPRYCEITPLFHQGLGRG